MFSNMILGRNNGDAIDITTGLIAHYPRTANANDIVGTYNGTDFNGVTYDGTSASYNGTNQYTDSSSDFTLNAGAVSFWVNIETIGDVARWIGSVGSTANTEAVSVMGRLDTNSKISVWGNTTGSVNRLVSTQTLSTATWYHIVILSTGTTWELYINTVKETLIIETGSNSGEWFNDVTSADRLTVGALGRSTTSTYADVDIGSTRVYDDTEAMTATKVNAIFQAERTTYGV